MVVVEHPVGQLAAGATPGKGPGRVRGVPVVAGSPECGPDDRGRCASWDRRQDPPIIGNRTAFDAGVRGRRAFWAGRRAVADAVLGRSRGPVAAGAGCPVGGTKASRPPRARGRFRMIRLMGRCARGIGLYPVWFITLCGMLRGCCSGSGVGTGQGPGSGRQPRVGHGVGVAVAVGWVRVEGRCQSGKKLK